MYLQKKQLKFIIGSVDKIGFVVTYLQPVVSCQGVGVSCVKIVQSMYYSDRII